MLVYKTSKANLENCTKLFLLMGLVSALLIVYYTLEQKIPVRELNVNTLNSFSNNIIEENIPEAPIEKEPIKAMNIELPLPVLSEIKIVSDEKKIKEVAIASTETNETEKVIIQPIHYNEVKEEKVVEEVVEDVPFFVIEEVPKFPGCEGTNEELRKCMQEKIQIFVHQEFNVDLSQELGLEPGVKKIFVAFTIDKNGNIINIKSRAPHKNLQAEAERVVKMLPKMEPGKQRGKPVRVSYTLPITFQVL